MKSLDKLQVWSLNFANLAKLVPGSLNLENQQQRPLCNYGMARMVLWSTLETLTDSAPPIFTNYNLVLVIISQTKRIPSYYIHQIHYPNPTTNTNTPISPHPFLGPNNSSPIPKPFNNNQVKPGLTIFHLTTPVTPCNPCYFHHHTPLTLLHHHFHCHPYLPNHPNPNNYTPKQVIRALAIITCFGAKTKEGSRLKFFHPRDKIAAGKRHRDTQNPNFQL
jgi:hypothetical protein